jgi:hypothetical protein
VRQPESRRDTRRDADRPVRPRRDEPFDFLGTREAVDGGLVLGRHEGAVVRVGEPDRAWVAVDRDGEEVTLAGGAEQADLRRAGT